MGHAQRELERAQRHDGLREHLTVGEEVRLAARQHWMVLAKPLLLALTVTVLGVLVLVRTPPRIGSSLPLVVLVIILGVWIRFAWRVLVRWHDMFVATDKRILKYQGIIFTDVPMMRMSKVTDMRFTRSLGGEIFGYGTIVIESAGQDQAIREVTYLPDPVENYRRLCEVIFGDKHAPGRGKKPKAWRRQLDRLAGRRASGGTSADDDRDESAGLDPENLDGPNARLGLPGAPASPAPAVPTHRPATPAEVLFESEDIKARRRAAKTGPIPYYSPDTYPTNNPD